MCVDCLEWGRGWDEDNGVGMKIIYGDEDNLWGWGGDRVLSSFFVSIFVGDTTFSF